MSQLVIPEVAPHPGRSLNMYMLRSSPGAQLDLLKQQHLSIMATPHLENPVPSARALKRVHDMLDK